MVWKCACDLDACACDLDACACGLNACACDLDACACDLNACACDLDACACDRILNLLCVTYTLWHFGKIKNVSWSTNNQSTYCSVLWAFTQEPNDLVVIRRVWSSTPYNPAPWITLPANKRNTEKINACDKISQSTPGSQSQAWKRLNLVYSKYWVTNNSTTISEV